MLYRSYNTLERFLCYSIAIIDITDVATRAEFKLLQMVRMYYVLLQMVRMYVLLQMVRMHILLQMVLLLWLLLLLLTLSSK